MLSWCKSESIFPCLAAGNLAEILASFKKTLALTQGSYDRGGDSDGDDDDDARVRSLSAILPFCGDDSFQDCSDHQRQRN